MSEKCKGCKHNTGNWRTAPYVCEKCSRFYKDCYRKNGGSQMNNKTFNLIRTVGEIAVPVIACVTS